jgi:soluble lytic murein transglycosylase-like protein
MVEDRENRQLNNLVAMSGNPLAAKAGLNRQGRASKPLPIAMGTGRQGPDSGFEAMMAMNKTQNSIIADVLDGPVSQQTQRQLAQIQAINEKNPALEEFANGVKAAKRGELSIAADAPGKAAANGATAKGAEAGTGNLSAVRKGARNLLPGSTIRVGAGTGKIFNTAQMAAYRQKYGGYQLRLPNQRQPITEASARHRDPSKQEAIESMSDSAMEAVNAAILQNQLDLHPELAATPPAKGSKSEDQERINGIIDKVGAALGLDPNLIKAVVKAESNYNRRAVSPAGAKGLMQLMPKTAKEMGVKDPFDPLENIWGGARYLKRMLDRHGGNLNKALAAYNWGPGNLDRHGYGNGQNLPSETRRYIRVVNQNYNRYKNDTGSA